MSGADWRPAASRQTLRERARLLAAIRQFFQARGVLEVETPLFSRTAATDPHLHSAMATLLGETVYAQTSPEHHMKRLLAAGHGDVFQLFRAVRDGEAGRWHNPEFTLLEWYRTGFDHHALMAELVDLVLSLHPGEDEPAVDKIAYRELFRRELDVDPLEDDLPALAAAAGRAGFSVEGELDRDAWLDLLMSHALQPRLPAHTLTLVYDYPASQAALARLNPDGRTAARFELFWGPVELANGYWELTDPAEQRQRFAADNARRARLGLPAMPVDEHLLAALKAGLPDCAGVALGIDRLLACQLGLEAIEGVLAFPFARA